MLLIEAGGSHKHMSVQAAITANYLKEPEDVQARIAAFEQAREILASAPLRGLAGREIHPGGRTSSREALAKIIRREAEHTYHLACTARIGTESSPAEW